MTGTPNPATRKAMAELEAGKGEPFDIAELGKEMKLSRYDTADYLKAEEDIAAYLAAVVEEGDPALIEAARDDVARARARIARTADTKR